MVAIAFLLFLPIFEINAAEVIFTSEESTLGAQDLAPVDDTVSRRMGSFRATSSFMHLNALTVHKKMKTKIICDPQSHH